MILELGYDSIDAPWWPFLFILLAGWLPTDVWRLLGVAFGGRMSGAAGAAGLARTVATALVAAVIAQLVLYPTGSLAALPTPLRIAALLAGFGTYILSGRRILLAIAAAEIVLLGGARALQPG